MPAPACSPRSTAPWPTFRDPASPAPSPSPTARCTTSPRPPPGGAPLNLLMPAKGEETDRRLRVIEAPGYGIVGKSATLARRHRRSRRARHPLAPPTSPSAATANPPRTESVPIGVEQTIEVPITRAGPTVIEMSASPLPGAVTNINNRAVVEINGVRDRLRVLLISGEPHPGERTWRRLLKADPSVDLVHFTILRPPEKDDRTPLNELALIAFPVRELFVDKINEFDLIILDRFQNRGLLPLPYLAQHRRPRAPRRRAADERRPGVHRCQQPRRDAARRRPARRPGATQRRGRWPVPAAGHRSRPAPSGDRGPRRRQPAGQDRTAARPGAPGIATSSRAVHGEVLMDTPDGDAAAGARPRRQGPDRAAAVRPDLAVVARP